MLRALPSSMRMGLNTRIVSTSRLYMRTDDIAARASGTAAAASAESCASTVKFARSLLTSRVQRGQRASLMWDDSPVAG